MTDFLSSSETSPCQTGQVVVNKGADQWVTWANGSGLTGAQIGVAVSNSLGGTPPGNPFTVVTNGRIPWAAFNIGAGQAASIGPGKTPGRVSSPPYIGMCDPAGEMEIFPSWVGTTVATVVPYSALTPSNFRGPNTPPTTVQAALDYISNSAGCRFVFVRNFCPPALLASFAALTSNGITPKLISGLYGNLAAAQTAFPYSTSATDLTSGTFATNSFDWLVINEAIRYSEANGCPTVWLDHPGVGSGNILAYGIIGTFVVHGGVMIQGQGSQGSNTAFGTPFVHFQSNADLFYFKGDLYNKGNYSAGTGGGLENVTIVKADRSTFGGTYYTGGCAIRIEAQNTAARPGEMLLSNILVYAEYDVNSNWTNGLIVDGSQCTQEATAGVRSVNMRKLRTAGCTDTNRSVWLINATHCMGYHIQADPVGAGTAGMTVSGGISDLNLYGIEVNGNLVIEDWIGSAANGANSVTISAATNTNPIVCTATAHGLPVGQTANVYITGATGNTAANGAWDNLGGSAGPATIIDANTFSIPATGNGTYGANSATVTQTSPRQVNIDGNFTGTVNNTGNSTTGILRVTGGTPPTYDPVTGSVINFSANPGLVLVSRNAPKWRLRYLSAEQDNVTGDGTTVSVLFNTVDHDLNGDWLGKTSPYSVFTCNYAGTYRIHCRCTVNGLNTSPNTNTFAALELNVSHIVGASESYQNRYIVPSNADSSTNQYMTMEVEATIYLSKGDTVTPKVEVAGGSTKTAGFGYSSDTGGLSWVSFEGVLLP